MKEFYFTFKDIAGLRSVKGVQLNTSGLAAAVNFRMVEGTAVSLQPPNYIGKLPEFATFPFPQIGLVENEPLLFDRGAIYELSPTWRPQLCFGGLSESGYPWSWAWVPGFSLFTNYRVIVERVQGVWGLHTLGTVPQCRALAEHNGQFVAGNTAAYGELLANRVMWAKPGTIDFRIDESNEAGSLIIKGVGSILGFGAVGPGIVVYGTDGVALLSPKPHPVWWGQDKLVEEGVASQLAHCGDGKEEFFVSKSGLLYKIGGDGIETLGYKPQLCAAAGLEMSMYYDSANKEVYVVG